MKKREYHVQHNKDVEHQYVKMYCETNQFPEVHFLGKHNKPHGVRGLGKVYHMCFDTKLVHGTCEINRVCVLHAHICSTNPGPQILHTRNNHIINLSKVAHTGLC